MRKPAFFLLILALTVSACFADGLTRSGHRRSHRARATSKTAAKASWLAHYEKPELDWIKSGIWQVLGTETGTTYHLPSCPRLLQQNPRGFIGWGSSQEALSVGRKPCPVCHAPDPRQTTNGRIRELFEKSSAALGMAQQVGGLGFISEAADYWQTGWIFRGDAFMIAADSEKGKGRLENARALYREAGNAYGRASSYLPAVPAPGATMAETGGMGLPSGVLGMAAGGGGGYNMGTPTMVSGVAGGIAF
ncbi:MAG: hypothetical protein COZ06_21170 [Armatimonadetes bacterium CG_4_10_14_3_um_filter_66_18]|nr:hypothetical protein [Armatimonadota bacterium]OIP03561.1 MAG: hypothetical protein AUJ96_14435 [Armatimonadetes bacterium CG2_30_66_41]PIU92092.1 MAG: hypothetical protein COS65_19740 [Armatimonadetes bacterium CG06_land_8_20_14_3_00_66_21]PIW19785.1 MAG: hypothetical protein COW34_03430 [Armatimonadetes bacterium CG17_big_fil_post_rev_8_21_14_2_50_66_6]PIX41592.1 MAG: hypothetical protein COZ57_23100 [Armatimonadetes bacterium CG_4_8_14_3_um_filter_66_20]PIY44171.1 MAG: hypothetical prote